MKVFRTAVWLQGMYILFTALWPILHIQSFLAVTGPKTDIWLVKTVAALLIPIALCLLSYTVIQTNRLPGILLGATTSIAFIIVDFHYALNNVISEIYMLDGLVEAGFLLLWAYLWFGRRGDWINA